MELIEAIEQRISRRNYLKTPLTKDHLNALQTVIKKLNEESGLTMLLIENASEAFNRLDKSYGMFKGVRTIIALKGGKADLNLKEKAGYFGEFAVLEATRMHLGTCWVGASFNSQIPALKVTDDEELLAVITIGYVAEESTMKENIIRKIAHGKTKPLDHFYSADTMPPDWFMKGIKAVQKAPSAINRQAYCFHYENKQVTAWAEETKKFDQIDLGIAKAHFAIAAVGTFAFGNGAAFTHKSESKIQKKLELEHA